MLRLMLNDEFWSQLKEMMLQHGIYDKPNLRMVVEAMLYRIWVGCPWRDLAAECGCWNSIYQKFNRWSSKGKLMSIFKELVQEPDLEWEFIDGSIVKAHQDSAGAASEENQAIGKSRGGNTTKIHMAVDAHGLPIDFEITGGEVHDCKVAPEFIEKLPAASHTIADKGYEGNMMHPSYVYILASQRNGTLYIGSTSDIIKRVWEHINKAIPGFTAKYNVQILVYYETHDLYIEAAGREKRFKNWPRQWKINLIEKFNPQWHDLYEESCQ